MFRERTIIIPDRNAENFAMRLNFYRLRDVKEKIFVNLDDVIHHVSLHQ